MTTPHTSAFLCSLAAGADLDRALAVGAAAPDRIGRGFADAREHLASGNSPAESLLRVPISSVVTTLCGRSPAHRLPLVADRLLRSLAPTQDRSAVVRHAMQLQFGLLTSAWNALIALSILAVFRTFVAPVANVDSSVGWLQFATASALVTAIILAAYELYRQRLWLARTRVEHSRIESRLLMYVAAGADAGVTAKTVLDAVDAPGHRGLIRRWRTALQNNDQDASVALREAGLLNHQVAHVAKLHFEQESPGAGWARASALVDGATVDRQLNWPAYTSMALSAVGVGLAIIGAWHMILHVVEVSA